VLRRSARIDGSVAIVTLLLNPTPEDRRFLLPEPHFPRRVLIDTADPEVAEYDADGNDVLVAARSAVLSIAEIAVPS